MAKTKVLLSLDEKDLELLDSRAQERRLDRSAYVASLLHPGGRPMVFYNEENYDICKKVFKLENPQHMVNYALSLLAKKAYESLAHSEPSQETTDDEPVLVMD